jgi:iron(III) transport system substrate-binding protein
MKTINQNKRNFLAASLGAALIPGAVWAQSRAAANAKIFMYDGPDRDAKLLEGARKEGVVNLYTSLNTKDSAPITEAFEKKYGIKVVMWRSVGEKVVQRAVAEAQAGRHAVDVFECGGINMEQMFREKLLTPFFSPHFKDLAPAALLPHRHWVGDRFNFLTMTYNTNLVKPDEVPGSYADLLHPRWAGRIGIEAGDVDWFASLVKYMGEEKGMAFFRQLAKSKPQVRSGHTLLTELVNSGEIPLAASTYNHSVERLVVKGAPVRWKALDPTFGRPNGVGMPVEAAHPHAGLLFADFMLSKEGQTLLKERNRVPASLAVETNLNRFPFKMIDMAMVLDENDKWEGRWSELFLGGQKVQKEEE